IPFSHYPKEKNRRKKKQQINRDQGGEANSNHGVALPGRLACGRVMSLPHSIVAIPQVKSASGLLSPGAFLGKRQRARQRRACSSNAGSPEEFIGKQNRISPSLLTATRKQI